MGVVTIGVTTMKLGAISANLEHASRVEEFAEAARHLMISGKNYGNAAKAARASGLTSRQVDFLEKAAVPAGSTGDSTWAQPLAPHPLAAAFLGSLVGTGLFESMLGSMIRLPLRTTVSSVTASVN